MPCKLEHCLHYHPNTAGEAVPASRDQGLCGRTCYVQDSGAPLLAVRERARHQRVLAPRPGVRQDDQAAGMVLYKVLQPRRAALHQARRAPRLLSMQQVHLRRQCNCISIISTGTRFSDTMKVLEGQSEWPGTPFASRECAGTLALPGAPPVPFPRGALSGSYHAVAPHRVQQASKRSSSCVLWEMHQGQEDWTLLRPCAQQSTGLADADACLQPPQQPRRTARISFEHGIWCLHCAATNTTLREGMGHQTELCR